MFTKHIKVIIWDYLSILVYQVDHFVKKSTIQSKWTPDISRWGPPDPDKNSKIVKKGRQDDYRMYQGNHKGLFINLGLQGESFRQKVHFMVKMDSKNQPSGILLILAKNKKLLKRVNRMLMKYIKLVIRDCLSFLGYQMDHFVKKSTFWSKWLPEISPVASP